MTFQRPSNSNSDLPTPLPTPLPTICQHLPTPLPTACFQPRIPPERWKRPTRPRWPLGVPAALKERTAEDRKGPHHRHHTTNAKPSADPAGIMGGHDRATNRLTWLVSTRSSVNCPPRSIDVSPINHLVAGCSSRTASGKSMGRISRAGANSVFHSVEADQARARRSTSDEKAECAEPSGIAWGPLLGRGGWGKKPASSPLSTSPQTFAALPKNSAHLLPALFTDGAR